jgi:hypothetical protein
MVHSDSENFSEWLSLQNSSSCRAIGFQHDVSRVIIRTSASLSTASHVQQAYFNRPLGCTGCRRMGSDYML